MCSEGCPAPSPLAFTRCVQGRRVPQGTKPGRSSEKSHRLGPGGHSRSVRTTVAGHATSELCFEGRVNHAKPEQGKRRLKQGSMQADLRPDARSRGCLGSAQAPRTGPEPHSSPGPSRVVDTGGSLVPTGNERPGKGPEPQRGGPPPPGPDPPPRSSQGYKEEGDGPGPHLSRCSSRRPRTGDGPSSMTQGGPALVPTGSVSCVCVRVCAPDRHAACWLPSRYPLCQVKVNVDSSLCLILVHGKS